MQRFGWIAWLAVASLALGCGGGTTPPADVQTVDTGVIVTGDTGVGGDTGVAGDTGTPTDTGMMGTARPQSSPTNGGGIALSPNGLVLVAANRDANSVSVFQVNASTTPPTLTR